MGIEIRDAGIEAKLQKQLQTTGSASVEEVLNRMLDTQEEQDRWLLERQETIRAKIRRGMDQLDRGEGIPEERLNAYLTELKRKTE
jgi:predicted transcriptional regulator